MDKLILYQKGKRVIESCKNKRQLEVAARYIHLLKPKIIEKRNWPKEPDFDGQNWQHSLDIKLLSEEIFLPK